jgi:hypothetical protein
MAKDCDEHRCSIGKDGNWRIAAAQHPELSTGVAGPNSAHAHGLLPPCPALLQLVFLESIAASGPLPSTSSPCPQIQTADTAVTVMLFPLVPLVVMTMLLRPQQPQQLRPQQQRHLPASRPHLHPCLRINHICICLSQRMRRSSKQWRSSRPPQLKNFHPLFTSLAPSQNISACLAHPLCLRSLVLPLSITIALTTVPSLIPLAHPEQVALVHVLHLLTPTPTSTQTPPSLTTCVSADEPPPRIP